MDKPSLLAQIRTRYQLVAPTLDERARRAVAAAEAQALGWGGLTLVAAATGLTRATIRRGRADLTTPAAAPPPGRLRHVGGGRNPLTSTDPGAVAALEALVEPTTRGDPESPLRWTCLSLRHLAAALRAQGHPISHQWVADQLHRLAYSLQANRKTHEGTDHPDRDAQFAHSAATSAAALAAGQPVISVDTKKKELVGDFKQGGREWRPAGQPEEVRVHDFPLRGPEGGRVSP